MFSLGLAGAQAAAGDLAGARKNCTEAVAYPNKPKNKISWGEALFVLGKVFRHKGNLLKARRNHQDALSIRNEIGQKEAADSRLEISKVLIDEGRIAEAEDLARQVAEEASRGHRVQLQAEAECVLANGFLARGRLIKARTAVARASDLLADGASRMKPSVAITQARVDTAGGKRGSAQGALRALRGVIAHNLKRMQRPKGSC